MLFDFQLSSKVDLYEPSCFISYSLISSVLRLGFILLMLYLLLMNLHLIRIACRRECPIILCKNQDDLWCFSRLLFFLKFDTKCLWIALFYPDSYSIQYVNYLSQGSIKNKHLAFLLCSYWKKQGPFPKISETHKLTLNSSWQFRIEQNKSFL